MRIVIKFERNYNQTNVMVNGRFFCIIEKRCGSPGETEYCVIHQGTHHVWKSMGMARRFAKDLATEQVKRNAYLANADGRNGA